MMHCIKDEQIGQLHRRTSDLIRRVVEGTISFDPTMNALQEVIEGKHEPAKAKPDERKVCGVFSSCKCTICGGFFGDGDDICANGHQIGFSYR